MSWLRTSLDRNHVLIGLLPALLAALILLADCSGDGTSSSPPQTVLRLREVAVSLDGVPFRAYAEFSGPIRIDGAGIVVAATHISLEVDVDSADPSLTCAIGARVLERIPNGRLKADVQPAYLSEELDLNCQSPGALPLHQAVIIRARDPQLEAAVEYYFAQLVPKKNNSVPEDPYSGYRVKSYYSEFQRFAMVADAYTNPVTYGVDPDGELRRSFEAYLINTSESYFEPCVNYDFDTGPLSQCRSPGRVGKYYRWRSPLSTGTWVETAHGMAEWRAGGGIAQAIKAILLVHADDERENCPISDEPSKIADASLVCRALNVRRLLYHEVWRKWSDEGWGASLGYSYQLTIPGTSVSHWISWTEFMVDLFRATAHIGAGPGCADCELLGAVPSRTDELLGFFWESGDGCVSVSCRPPHAMTGCDFQGDDLQCAKSDDLSHLSSVIHLVTMYDQERLCTSDQRQCIDVQSLADTMRRETWVDWIPNDDVARGFPKFDLFFNGYCSRAAFDSSDPLHEFCVSNWFSETGAYPLHRNLFGFVNLGRIDRDLMLKLRQAADENHDGVLDGADKYHQTFSIMLYKAIVLGPR